jgi:hypothetical protein
VPRSGARDMPLLWPFQSFADTVKDTTELRNITTQYAVSKRRPNFI